MGGGFFFEFIVIVVQSLSHVWSHGLQHTRLPCLLPTPRACSNSCPYSRWCHPNISSSVVSFFSWLQSFPASRSFPMSWLFASGGQSIGASASASVPPMCIQDWFPLGWTGLISLLSKGLSRVFSITTVQKLQFFGIQLSLCSNSLWSLFVCLSLYWDVKLWKWGGHERKTETQTEKSWQRKESDYSV